jgi:hypothetical protein
MSGRCTITRAGTDPRVDVCALSAVEALARGEGGPLCGIPVTTKDSHWMSGVESTAGSRARRGFVPAETAASIERLQAAGAVIFARTTTPEFCYFGVTESALFGRTTNPWNLGRTPGGSSGGAAAAVASRCGPLSLGGHGGGSIRIPAAFCGIVGRSLPRTSTGPRSCMTRTSPGCPPAPCRWGSAMTACRYRCRSWACGAPTTAFWRPRRPSRACSASMPTRQTREATHD